MRGGNALELQLALAQQITHTGSWGWQLTSGDLTWSPELFKIYGVDPDAFQPTFASFLDRVHPDDRARVRSTVEQALTDRKAFDFEERILQPNGQVRFLRSRGEVLCGAGGQPEQVVGTCQDITELKRTEGERRLLLTVTRTVGEAEDLHGALAMVLEEVCRSTGWVLGQAWLPTEDDSVLECSPSWFASVPGLDTLRQTSLNIAFHRGEGLPGQAWASARAASVDELGGSALPRASVAHAVGLRTSTAVPVLAGEEVVAVLEFFGQAPQPDEHRQLEVISALAAQVGAGVRRRRAEDALRGSRLRLQALARHLQMVREDERSGIARELHDELGQVLTALKMDLAWLARRLSSPEVERPVLQRIETMDGLIDVTLDRVRRISSDLRPAVLDGLGLISALEWQASEFQERTGIPCAVRTSLDALKPDGPTSTALFRIFQEALTNVARHARARRVQASLGYAEGRLVLEVRDDGQGMDRRRLAHPGSLGILGMRERAEALGGDLRITTVSGQGTTVTVSLPR